VLLRLAANYLSIIQQQLLAAQAPTNIRHKN